MSNTILVYDTECSSLDLEHGFIQELAWAVYDVQTKRLLYAKSRLLKWNIHFVVEPGAFEATGLTREFSEAHGLPAADVFTEFLIDCEKSEFVAGHNILGYDHLMVASNVKRCLFGEPLQLNRMLAIDTMIDVPYPASQKYMALKYLALDHGYVMSNAHQAMADVFACAHILFSYPFEQCLEIAKTPLVLLHAYTDYFDKESRDKLHTLKFKWNRERKRWEKRTRGFYVVGTQMSLSVSLFVDDKEAFGGPTEAQEIPFNGDRVGDQLPF